MTTQLINGTYRQIPASVAECYDLRTGEIYYDIPVADGGVTPSIVAYTTTGNLEVPEAQAGQRLQAELLSISGGYLLKINPYSGAISVNVSISPLTGSGGTFYNQIQGYSLAIQDLGISRRSQQIPTDKLDYCWIHQ